MTSVGSAPLFCSSVKIPFPHTHHHKKCAMNINFEGCLCHANPKNSHLFRNRCAADLQTMPANTVWFPSGGHRSFVHQWKVLRRAREHPTTQKGQIQKQWQRCAQLERNHALRTFTKLDEAAQHQSHTICFVEPKHIQVVPQTLVDKLIFRSIHYFFLCVCILCIVRNFRPTPQISALYVRHIMLSAIERYLVREPGDFTWGTLERGTPYVTETFSQLFE